MPNKRIIFYVTCGGGEDRYSVDNAEGFLKQLESDPKFKEELIIDVTERLMFDKAMVELTIEGAIKPCDISKEEIVAELKHHIKENTRFLEWIGSQGSGL